MVTFEIYYLPNQYSVCDGSVLNENQPAASEQ